MRVIVAFLLLLFSHCSQTGTVSPHVYRFEGVLISDGLARQYVLNLPAGYYNSETASYPLVIALHGTGGSAAQMERMYGLNEKASAAGFVVVYPEGVRSDGVLGLRTWNTGRCCDYAHENNIDDTAFIEAMIDDLTGTFKINPKRVYITGMSNGGMMAYTLACRLSLRIAAIAAVSATMMLDKPCEPARPVPILHLHSVRDTKVPYAGGVGIGGYYFPPVDSVLRVWALQNECAGEPVAQDNGLYVSTRWNGCDARSAIECYLTDDGGHAWPGGMKAGAWADEPSAAINANDLLWEFFQRFELP